MRQKFLYVLLIVPLLLVSSHLFAQERMVSGIVRSADDNSTLPGVNVIAISPSGKTSGASTDFDGKFQLMVPLDATGLRFTFVGMVTQDVDIKGKTFVEVTMAADSKELDEVVVVGYSVQRKEALTSSVSTVSAEKLTKVSDSNVEKLLQGNAPGVLVSSSRGNPGSAASISIRGASSINAGTQPLYVIDGVPVVSGTTGAAQSFSVLSSLNPNDIKSMTILKDAGATAIYGARAANGVVIIETKSGAEGETKIDVSYENGVSVVNNDGIKMLNSSQLLMLQREAVQNSYQMTGSSKFDWTNPTSEYYLPDALANTNTNWWDEISRSGKMENFNVSVTGGDSKNKFFVSGGYHNNDGAIMNFGFKRYTGTAKLDHTSKDNKFKVGAKTSGSFSKQNFVLDNSNGVLPWENPVFAAMVIPSYYAPFNADGTVNQDLNGIHGNYNHFVVEKYQDKYQNYTKALSSAYVSYKFFDMFEAKSTFGLDYGYTKNYEFQDPRALIYAGDQGSVWESHRFMTSLTSSNLLTFSKVFAEKHSVSVIAGQEATKDKYSYISGGGKGTTHELPYLTSLVADGQFIGGNPSDLTRFSLFGFASYSYNSRYYLQASVRRDGASVFGANHKYGVFGSASASWRISQEEFFKVDQINDLKLRLSYGTTGNSDIGWYQSKGNYSSVSYAGGSGLQPNTIANPDLRWEKTASFDVAIDYAILNNRITGTIEYYNNKTSDMLLRKELSYTSGFGSIMTNVGSLRNTGWEIAINTVNLNGELKWSTGINVSLPSSEILDLGGSEYVGSSTYRQRVGGKYAEYWMYKYAGVNPANGMPMWYDAKGNITFDYGSAARYNVGSPEPDFFGSITNNLSWKGIALDFMFYFMYGNEAIYNERRYSEHDGNNWGSNANENQLNRWQKPGDITDTPKPMVNNATGAYDWSCSRWVDDGSYLRLKYVTLSYTLPSALTKKVNVSRLTVYAKGNNLWTLASVNGLDVERSAWGTGTFTYPATRSFSLGVDISF